LAGRSPAKEFFFFAHVVGLADDVREKRSLMMFELSSNSH